MVQIDIQVVQCQKTMKVVEVFASQSAFSEWWNAQENPHDKYNVIYRDNVAQVKQVLTTV